jgi:hypothetical protein
VLPVLLVSPILCGLVQTGAGQSPAKAEVLAALADTTGVPDVRSHRTAARAGRLTYIMALSSSMPGRIASSPASTPPLAEQRQRLSLILFFLASSFSLPSSLNWIHFRRSGGQNPAARRPPRVRRDRVRAKQAAGFTRYRPFRLPFTIEAQVTPCPIPCISVSGSLTSKLWRFSRAPSR